MTTNFEGKRILISGGLGFIGANLAHCLCRTTVQAEITLVDNLFPSYGGNKFNIHGIDDKVKIEISDIRNVEAMRTLVKGKDYLFNLAGQTSHLDSMTDPFTDLDINCRAQLSILEVCREVNPGVKIVFASTRQLYGRPDYLPVDEKHLLRPVDVNGINKMAGEWYHILYNNVYGVKTCALRLTNTYGPRMRVKDARQTFLGVWIRRLIEGKPFDVWGGNQLRDFTYVDDVVDALLLAAHDEKACGKIYNLGGECVISLIDLAKLLVKVNNGGRYSACEFPPERKIIDIGDYYADYSLISRELGWNPRIGLEDGLGRTIDYYRQYLAEYL